MDFTHEKDGQDVTEVEERGFADRATCELVLANKLAKLQGVRFSYTLRCVEDR